MDHPESRRRSIRLRDYDYSDQGPYFITICTSDRLPLFGEISGNEMVLTPLGEIVAGEWRLSETIRPGLILDAFVVMPNHFHGVVTFGEPPHSIDDLVRPPGGKPLARRPRSLGSFVAGFKSATTKRINEHRGTPRVPVWQRNYFEHIVRSEKALDRLRNYIETNPQRWEFDQENPARHDSMTGRYPGRSR